MDRLADEVVSLLLAIPPLEHALEGHDEDRGMRVAVRILAEVADGLLEAFGAHTPAVAGRLRAHGVSLLDHLARVQACSARLLSAYEELVQQRRLGAPNWSLLRSRLDAALELLVELVTPGLAEVVYAIASCKPPAAEQMRTLACALERLQGAVSRLVAHLRASRNVAEDPGGARAARGRS